MKFPAPLLFIPAALTVVMPHLAQPLQAAESRGVLRALVQDSQPKYIVEDGSVSGMCHEIYARLRQRLQKQNIQLKVDNFATPIKRILSNLEHGEADLFCGAGRNKQREARFIYSTKPIYQVANVVVAHADDGYTPESLQQLASDGISVGALYGTSSAAYLKSHDGIQVVDHFHDLQEPLRWISLKKLRLFYYHDLGLNYLVKHSPYSLKVVATKFRTTPQWIIYSKKTKDDLIQVLDQEISDMVLQGEMGKITSRYID